MLTFLRKIRRSLVESGSARKYILYAIGEIALVVLGILIALQINNWNEGRKDKETLNKLFSSLIVSLQKDSNELVRILDYMENSVQAHKLILDGSAQSLIQRQDSVGLYQLLGDAFNGVNSF